MHLRTKQGSVQGFKLGMFVFLEHVLHAKVARGPVLGRLSSYEPASLEHQCSSCCAVEAEGVERDQRAAAAACTAGAQPSTESPRFEDLQGGPPTCSAEDLGFCL